MMILALSLSLMTLFAAGVEPFKISKANNQQHQLEGQQSELAPFQNQGPQFSTNQWEPQRGLREQEYSTDYYNQRPTFTSGGSYYREAPLRGYEQQEYNRGFEAPIRGAGSYQEREKEYSNLYQQQPLTRQPQYSPTAYGSQQLALVLIRPLQLSSQQQNYPADQLPSYANLLMQAPLQPAGPFGTQRPDPLPLPVADQQQQQQQFGAYGAGQDKFGGVFARSHEKLSKLKNHLEKFAADAKAKLNFGSTYHYNGEETLPGPLPPQPYPAPGPLPGPSRPQLPPRPQLALGQQQQQLQGQLELTDIQLSKQEQEKIRQNKNQEKLEQQELSALEQDKQQTAAKQPESVSDIIQLPIKQQQVSETSAKAAIAADSNEGFGRRESPLFQQAKTTF